MTRPMILETELFARVSGESGAWKHRALWYIVGWLIAGTFVAIGSGYAVGSYTSYQEQSLSLLVNIEGSVRVHGIILISLAMVFCFALGHYSKLTWLALKATTFYSLVTAILIFLGWFFGPVTWGAPWWYLLTAALSMTLMVLAPDTGSKGEPVVRTLRRHPGRS